MKLHDVSSAPLELQSSMEESAVKLRYTWRAYRRVCECWSVVASRLRRHSTRLYCSSTGNVLKVIR